VDCDAVAAVKNGQAVVAEIRAWFDNELHMWFLPFLILYVTIINEFLKNTITFFGSEVTHRAKQQNNLTKKRLKLFKFTRKIKKRIKSDLIRNKYYLYAFVCTRRAAARSITGLAGRGPRRQPPARSMTGLRGDGELKINLL
tara:strand:- start:841 stop:1266 length:426 start_codon:yes stop_codon:yes gene_type:complete